MIVFHTFKTTPLPFTNKIASSSQFLCFFAEALHQKTLYCLNKKTQLIVGSSPHVYKENDLLFNFI